MGTLKQAGFRFCRAQVSLAATVVAAVLDCGTGQQLGQDESWNVIAYEATAWDGSLNESSEYRGLNK